MTTVQQYWNDRQVDSPGDLLPPVPPELEPGCNVTVHSANRAFGGPVEYPGVVLDVYPATERALVKCWRFEHVGWEIIGIASDRLEIGDHEIGQCMDCGRYDWYHQLSEDECLCAGCAETRQREQNEFIDSLWDDERERRWEAACSRADDARDER